MQGRVAIIGGGIGGLAAAVHLQATGWTVEVHERGAALPVTGTALGLWPGALAALDTIGVGREVREQGRAQLSGAILRPDGRRIASMDVEALAKKTGDPIHLLSRPPLLRILAGALAPGVLRFGAEIADVRSLSGYDAVIAADGIGSRARTALFGARYGTRYVGATTWRGAVDGEPGGFTESWGEGKRFGITPQESGRTNWFACVRTAPGGRAAGGEAAELRRHFGHWHAAVRRVLDLVTEDAVLRHDLYEVDPALPSYVRGRVALIGDAAHAMTPDLGRGACEALVDGVAVAVQLAKASTVEEALAGYDAQRRRPTQRLARASRMVNRMAHARRLLPLRNAAMRLASAVGPQPG